MKLQSGVNFPNPNVGDTVRIQVPGVDKGKTDARSVLARVLEHTEDNMFKVGTRNGVLKQLYARSQFTLCHEKFLTPQHVPQELISLRTVALAQALGHGQGFTRCHCTQRCKTKRCLCVENGILCNPKYYTSQSCCNK